nr:MAG TPA: hypothetical protein [Caudoviricetes sp.]
MKYILNVPCQRLQHSIVVGGRRFAFNINNQLARKR